MDCCQHKERRAVGRCVDCGRSLCGECMRRWTPSLCDDCAEIRCSSVMEPSKGTVKLSCVLGAAGWIGAMVWLFPSIGWAAWLAGLVSAYICAGIPFGWVELGKRPAVSMLRVPVLGGILKLCAAPFVGVALLPISLNRIRTNW